jgi:hypothetical protein
VQYAGQADLRRKILFALPLKISFPGWGYGFPCLASVLHGVYSGKRALILGALASFVSGSDKRRLLA